MDLRAEIHERIDQLDDAVLPEVVRELDALQERRERDFPPEFLDMVKRVRERNLDLNEDEAANLANDAVKWARQSRNR